MSVNAIAVIFLTIIEFIFAFILHGIFLRRRHIQYRKRILLRLRFSLDQLFRRYLLHKRIILHSRNRNNNEIINLNLLRRRYLLHRNILIRRFRRNYISRKITFLRKPILHRNPLLHQITSWKLMRLSKRLKLLREQKEHYRKSYKKQKSNIKLIKKAFKRHKIYKNENRKHLKRYARMFLVLRIFIYFLISIISLYLLRSFNAIVNTVFNSYKEYIQNSSGIFIIILILLFVLLKDITKYLRQQKIYIGDGVFLFLKSLGFCYIIAILLIPMLGWNWYMNIQGSGFHAALIETGQAMVAFLIAILVMFFLFLISYMILNMAIVDRYMCKIKGLKSIHNEMHTFRISHRYISYRKYKHNEKLCKSLNYIISIDGHLINHGKLSKKVLHYKIGRNTHNIKYAKKNNIAIVHTSHNHIGRIVITNVKYNKSLLSKEETSRLDAVIRCKNSKFKNKE